MTANGTNPKVSMNGPAGARHCLAVGFDRSESSRLAVSWAAEQLYPQGRLVLVHACRPLHAPPSALPSARERRELGQAMIDELLLEASGPLLDIELEADISDHDPVTALVDAAARHGADGIVLGHERHSPIHRALGTVTSELLARSAVPVTTVPLPLSRAIA